MNSYKIKIKSINYEKYIYAKSKKDAIFKTIINIPKNFKILLCENLKNNYPLIGFEFITSDNEFALLCSSYFKLLKETIIIKIIKEKEKEKLMKIYNMLIFDEEYITLKTLMKIISRKCVPTEIFYIVRMMYLNYQIGNIQEYKKIIDDNLITIYNFLIKNE